MSHSIRVDPALLYRLADTCHGIAAQLDALGTTVFDAPPSVTGDPRLSDTLGDYHDGWSKRRGRLVEELAGAGAALDTIAESFLDTDANLAAG